jgi:hypothetical protein
MTEAELKAEQDILVLKRLADASNRLLQDEGFLELLRTLKSEAIREWSEGKHTEHREAAWYDLQAAARLENTIRDLPTKWALQKRKVDTMTARKHKG